MFMTISTLQSLLLTLPTMFQALFFQEREAAKDFKNHQKSTKPVMPRSPKIGNPRVLPQPTDTTIKKRPTQSNLVGGKGLFLNMGKKQ
ncbi:hypothetical protein QTG54_003096 [Skeletonema marinoi]|uniref:Secreted protein n=1 Tax=Skeletonema marinoi TaxID=267567 RepID=A0AAD9DHP7_9STRA|nr:hypothetical protein QTG54_003096 [Skeletonema marinoi]